MYKDHRKQHVFHSSDGQLSLKEQTPFTQATDDERVSFQEMGV